MRHDPSPLYLYEEVLLLALRDREGTIRAGTLYQLGMGAAILAELLLRGRAKVDLSQKRKYVEPGRQRPIGDAILDECAEAIDNAKRRKTVQAWISKFARLKRLKHRVAEQLCHRRILRVDQDRILGIFRRTVFPELAPQPERRLIDRLRKAIMSDSGSVDDRTRVLISIARTSKLLPAVFTKAELKDRKQRIDRIVDKEALGEAIKEASAAVQAAVLTGVIVPTIIASHS
jgi:hypothetical protein